jgi:beta-galactosidase
MNLGSTVMHEFSGVPIGVHYYRAPTPVRAEWDQDLANIRELGFDFIQMRAQWRWHERNEGELRFDDADELFDLARKHELGVLVQVYVPSAPQWLYDNYDVMRMTPAGETMGPVTYGAVYVGGFAPCSDRAIVRQKAGRFVRALTERYRDHPALFAWNAWNEPRSMPAGDCACPESMSKFREWLKSRFGTVEALNEFAGLALPGRGPDFSAVPPPDLYSDYAGWMLFRTWRTEMIADRVAWVAGEIRGIDQNHPVMSHSGLASVFHDALEDTTNDYLNAQGVDVYGSSCPSRSVDMPLLAVQPTAYQAATLDLLCARLRMISDPFWINELYTNEPMCLAPTPASFFRQSAYNAIASGAKGIVYWQYRGERLSTESFDAGLTTVAGEATDRSREVGRVIGVVKAHEDILASARVPEAAIAMPYDYQSDLISRIEAESAPAGAAGHESRLLYPYRAALRGSHLAMWELDLPMDVVPTEEYERILRYQVIYLPCPRMISTEQTEVLDSFVSKGGLLICEPSPAMRDANGWLQPSVPPDPLARLLGAREASRTFAKEERVLGAESGNVVCPPGLYVTALQIDEDEEAAGRAEVVASWGNGDPAIVQHVHGKGRTIYLGLPLGEVYFYRREEAVLRWIAGTLQSHGIEMEGALGERRQDVRVRRLAGADGSEILFVTNYREEPVDVAISKRGAKRIEELTDLGLELEEAGDEVLCRVPAADVAILRLTA